MIKNRIELAEHFNKLEFKVGAEIGVADGRYSEILCQKIPGLKLHCVDPWTPYDGNWRSAGYQSNAHKTAQYRLKPYKVKIIKKTSIEASLDFKPGSLDFVFIDGVHTFDYVMEDIIGWTRKVKKGGIVSGHEYYSFSNSGVIEAVDYYTKIHNIKLNIIPKYVGGHKDDNAPCWYFYVS